MIEDRDRALVEHLRRYDSVLVAFSGGADSAYVLAAAVDALGPDAVRAATAVSPSLPQRELGPAGALAASLGVEHLTPQTDELHVEGYRANGATRCYFCKSTLIDTLLPLAGAATVLTGTNADDAVAGFRPGIAAADERGAQAPLRDLGFTKAEVRDASRARGLVTWDKPAAACLSSRVAYGLEISRERLARIEAAEARLRELLPHVRDLRVRDHGDRATVEVDAHAITAVTPAVLAQLTGWRAVEVDPRGFRSGSMNELLGT